MTTIATTATMIQTMALRSMSAPSICPRVTTIDEPANSADARMPTCLNRRWGRGSRSANGYLTISVPFIDGLVRAMERVLTWLRGCSERVRFATVHVLVECAFGVRRDRMLSGVVVLHGDLCARCDGDRIAEIHVCDRDGRAGGLRRGAGGWGVALEASEVVVGVALEVVAFEVARRGSRSGIGFCGGVALHLFCCTPRPHTARHTVAHSTKIFFIASPNGRLLRTRLSTGCGSTGTIFTTSR